MAFLARQSGYIHIHLTWAGGKFCSITRGQRERERARRKEDDSTNPQDAGTMREGKSGSLHTCAAQAGTWGLDGKKRWKERGRTAGERDRARAKKMGVLFFIRRLHNPFACGMCPYQQPQRFFLSSRCAWSSLVCFSLFSHRFDERKDAAGTFFLLCWATGETIFITFEFPP